MEQGLWHQGSWGSILDLFLLPVMGPGQVCTSLRLPSPTSGWTQGLWGWCVQGDLLLYPLLGLSGTPWRGYFVLMFV